MADFLHSYKLTADSEGGYSNDPKDAGGETYRGISRKDWPTWAGWPLLDKLKPLKHGQVVNDADLESQVRIFYRQNFWGKIQGDLINSQKVADSIYDWYVNAGTHATKAVQTVLGFTGDEVDGRIGAGTLKAINAKGEAYLLQRITEARKNFYQAIVAAKPAQKIFLNGWLSRADRFA